MSILDNYTETHNSNNKFKFHAIPDNIIVIGGTAEHTFILPFRFTNYIKESEVLYRQGVTTIIEKPANDILEDCRNTRVTVKLDTDETLLFSRFLLDTFVQLKLTTNDGDIFYTDLIKLKLTQPIEDKPEIW